MTRQNIREARRTESDGAEPLHNVTRTVARPAIAGLGPVPRGASRSVSRALGILVYISRSAGSLSFVDLQKTLRLPKASLHKLLFTLESLGFLIRDSASGRYTIGWAALELSANTGTSGGIVGVISPVLRKLVDKYNETGHIGVLDGTEELIVERIDPPDQVLRLAIGRRHPAYCTSGGLASLAARDEVALAGLPEKLRPLTPNSLKSRKALVSRLKQVRADGYALDLEEAYVGVRCIGVAIDVPGWPVAAISLSLPLQRASISKLQEYAKPMKEAAAEIAAKLAVTPRS